MFGQCELDIQLYTLYRSGEGIRLSPKVFQALVYLLEHRERVVSKQELAEQVWPDQFISDATLESAVREVRKVVGDNGRDQRIIRTQRGHGYRFVAEIDRRRRPADAALPSANVPEALSALTPTFASEPPFVGRDDELATLHELWECVERGEGQIVHVQGASGAGVSRLVSEFRTRLRGHALSYLAEAGPAYGYPIPYQPIREVARQSTGITAQDNPDMMRSKLQQHLDDLTLGHEAHIESLEYLLDLSRSSQSLRPQNHHLRIVTLWRRLLLARSTHHPLLLIIEEVDKIDTASIACLRALMEALSQASILLITTSHAATLPAWLDKPNTTFLGLAPLPPEAVLALAQTQCPASRWPTTVSQRFLAATRGHPLFVLTLAREMDQHVTAEADFAWPSSVLEGLRLQLYRLPQEYVQLLQHAAVIGPSFSLDILQSVWPNTDDCSSHLLELEQVGWCQAQPGSHVDSYRFSHTLIWEVVYASLPRSGCQQLHAAIGHALEARHPASDISAAIRMAYHYEQAQQADKAIPYLTQYAERVARQYAHMEAMQALQAALNIVTHLPNERQTHSRLDLVQRLCQSRLALGHVQDALADLLDQQSHTQELRETFLTASYALLTGQALSRLGHWEQAAEKAHQALEAASPCRDDALMGQAYYLLAMAHDHAGQPALGVQYSRQAVPLLERSNESYPLGRAYLVLGLHALMLGDFAAALDAASQLRAIGETIDEHHLQVLAHWLSGWTLATQGDGEAAIAACQHGLQMAQDPLSQALAQGGLGYAYLEHAEVAEAIPRLERAVQHLGRLAYRRFEGLYTILAGEAYRRDGQLDTALWLTQQGLTLVRQHSYPLGVGWAQRTLGRIAQDKGQLEETEQYLQDALTTFTALQARFEMGRTHVMCAEAAYQQGKRQILVSHWTEAHHLFQVLQVPIYQEQTSQQAKAFEITSFEHCF